METDVEKNADGAEYVVRYAVDTDGVTVGWHSVLYCYVYVQWAGRTSESRIFSWSHTPMETHVAIVILLLVILLQYVGLPAYASGGVGIAMLVLADTAEQHMTAKVDRMFV
jgi:low affinity Fe/Cu permease